MNSGRPGRQAGRAAADNRNGRDTGKWGRGWNGWGHGHGRQGRHRGLEGRGWCPKRRRPRVWWHIRQWRHNRDRRQAGNRWNQQRGGQRGRTRLRGRQRGKRRRAGDGRCGRSRWIAGNWEDIQPAETGGTIAATGGTSSGNTTRDTASSSGCSCRLAGAETAGRPGFALLALLMFARRLRKRR